MRNPLFLTKSDRRALIVLALIALLCVAGMVLWGNKAEGAGDENVEDVEKTEAQEPVTAAISDDMVDRTEKITMKIFDPNTVDSVSLVGMGLTPKKVHTFMRYRTAGAVFRKAEDIARCYSFSDDDIDRLLPYVRISQQYSDSGYKREKYPLENHEDEYVERINHGEKQSFAHSSKFTTLTPVDVNTADTALLKRIPGVGDAISSMILNLREKFGGFTSVDQLREIHQISPELMEWFVVGDSPSLRRINVNTASFKTLVTHPYISRQQANDILRYVRLYGRISDMGALSDTGIFSKSELDNLAPYLEF